MNHRLSLISPLALAAFLFACGHGAAAPGQSSSSTETGSGGGLTGASSSGSPSTSSEGSSSSGSSAGGSSATGWSAGGSSAGGSSAGGSSASSSSSGGSSSGQLGGCGGDTCVGAETCVNDRCVVTGCVGVTVPGDYATVQAAVTAHQQGGTICVRPGVYHETVDMSYGDGDLVIQGESAATTRIDRITSEQPAFFQSLTLRGLAFGDANSLQSETTTIENCSFGDATSSHSLRIYGGDTTTIRHARFRGGLELLEALTTQTTLDSLDVSAPNDGVDLEYGTVVARNLYLHDCGGAGIASQGADVVLESSTFTDDLVGILLSYANSHDGSLTWSNTILARNGLGIQTDHEPDAQSNNALFGNTTNYQGLVGDGADYVKQDCLLTGDAPPQLGAGSPCIGAGAADHTAATDYYDRTRPTPPSIGAVEP